MRSSSKMYEPWERLDIGLGSMLTARLEIPSIGSWGLRYGRAGIPRFMVEGATEHRSYDRRKISGGFDTNVRKLAARLLLGFCVRESLDFEIRDRSTAEI